MSNSSASPDQNNSDGSNAAGKFSIVNLNQEGSRGNVEPRRQAGTAVTLNQGYTPDPAYISLLIEMARNNEQNLGKFLIGNHWLGKVPNSKMWYRCSYPPNNSNKSTQRVTLRTPDREEAEILLAMYVSSLNSQILTQQNDFDVAAAITLYLQDKNHKKSWSGSRSSLMAALETTLPGIKISEFTRRKQKALLTALHAGPLKRKLMAGACSNAMILVQAAINAVCDDEEDGERLCTASPYRIIYKLEDVAKFLNLPVPKPRNGHASKDEMVEIIYFFRDNEPMLRWLLLAIAFAGRPSATDEVLRIQFDERRRRLDLKHPDKPQKQNKYRPEQPVPPSVFEELRLWEEEVWCGLGERALIASFARAREELGLHEDVVPSSMRDFVTTCLREAEADYGVPYVPPFQEDMWLGHRHKGVNLHYGKFGPRYLLRAQIAIEALVRDLDDRTGGLLLRKARAAGTLPARGWQPIAAKFLADDVDEIGSIAPYRARQPTPIKVTAPWGVPGVVGSKEAISGRIGPCRVAFSQVAAKHFGFDTPFHVPLDLRLRAAGIALPGFLRAKLPAAGLDTPLPGAAEYTLVQNGVYLLQEEQALDRTVLPAIHILGENFYVVASETTWGAVTQQMQLDAKSGLRRQRHS